MSTGTVSTGRRTQPIRRATTAATLAVTALALSACGANTLQDRSKPTITLDQARTRIDGYLAGIQAQLPVQPASLPPAFSDLECDANDIGPHGRKQTSRSYTYPDLPLADRTKAADAFRGYLTGQGFQAVPDAAGSHPGWVRLKNSTDEFLAVLDGATDPSRSFRLTVSSPCVWPDGTPAK
ncbi:hypothetical protein ACFWIQ_27760 [Kitasatospora sp. NPDC127059]|uniref:hypothetical protein n=1 Tax=unclassified Kitasatospora TaxID=2633591 RepID=UPI00365A7693